MRAPELGLHGLSSLFPFSAPVIAQGTGAFFFFKLLLSCEAPGAAVMAENGVMVQGASRGRLRMGGDTEYIRRHLNGHAPNVVALG
jgi:hypothetical protein